MKKITTYLFSMMLLFSFAVIPVYALDGQNVNFDLHSIVYDDGEAIDSVVLKTSNLEIDHSKITKDMFKGIKNKKRYWCTRNLDSGTHTTMMIAKSDLETLLNSFGEVQSMKTIDTPYNTIKFFQF